MTAELIEPPSPESGRHELYWVPKIEAPDWRNQAECGKLIDPRVMYPPTDSRKGPKVSKGEAAVIKEFCDPCPVRLDCLASAIIMRDKEGVRGGTAKRQRKRLQDDYREKGAVKVGLLKGFNVVSDETSLNLISLPADPPSTAEEQILYHLDEHHGGEFTGRVQDLAAEIGISPNNMYVKINNLARSGRILKILDPNYKNRVTGIKSNSQELGDLDSTSVPLQRVGEDLGRTAIAQAL